MARATDLLSCLRQLRFSRLTHLSKSMADPLLWDSFHPRATRESRLLLAAGALLRVGILTTSTTLKVHLPYTTYLWLAS
jgi:hypothetical protein